MSASNDKTPMALAGAAGVSQHERTDSQKIQHSFPVGNKSPQPPQPLPWPSSFKLGEDGIYKTKMRENDAPIDTWVFSTLIVEAQTRDIHGQNWGLLLAIKTRDGRWNRWAMPMQLTSGNGNAYREILLNMGLSLGPGAQKDLHTYLVTARPDKILLCVPTIGWHNGVYVLPDNVYGNSKESVTLQTISPDTLFRVNGSLQDWQEHIGQYCPGNSRLTFAVCAALAAPLLDLCGLEGGGVHFMGPSSIGKSLLLQVAGSVAGGGGKNGFLRRWRTTDNALESVALSHNDALLCLDEIGQVEPRVAAEVSYMLANGQGKARATKEGIVRPLQEWRLIFLSNGELSLEQKLQEEGRRYMAGQAVRVLDIPANAGMGHGIFENLYDFADGKHFADHLFRASLAFYGAPFRFFLNEITQNLQEVKHKIFTMFPQFEKQLCPNTQEGQINRAAKRFALFAVAGELAIELKVFPWEPGSALTTARRCFLDWITSRGGTGAAEAKEAIRVVRAFIAIHSTSRFEQWGKEPEMKVGYKSAGFYRKVSQEVEFMIQQDVFRQEVCSGKDHKAIARHLLDAGYLVVDRSGSFIKTHRPIPLKPASRFYTIKGDILDSEE